MHLSVSEWGPETTMNCAFKTSELDRDTCYKKMCEIAYETLVDKTEYIHDDKNNEFESGKVNYKKNSKEYNDRKLLFKKIEKVSKPGYTVNIRYFDTNRRDENEQNDELFTEIHFKKNEFILIFSNREYLRDDGVTSDEFQLIEV